MVFLKSVEISGFKSFDVDHKARIDFDRGFTVLTGPIGSGKSNVVDAVRFALGEPNPKSLRAPNLGGLLFDTPSKKSTYAWIKVLLDNSDSSLPTSNKIVEIKRKLSVKGSTYFIDRRRVPRKRLLKFLEVAGIRPDSLNIVAQGTAIRIAEVELRDLRHILDEITGIAVYDRRRREAENNLKEADHVIEVKEARIDEIKKGLKYLEGERNDLLRFNLVNRDVNRLSAIRLSHEIGELRSTVERLEKARMEKDGRNEELRSLEEDLRNKRRVIQNQLDESKLAEKKLRLVECEGRGGQGEREIRDLRSRVRRLKKRLTGLKRAKKEALRALSHLTKEADQVKGELKKAKHGKSELEKELREKTRVFRKLVTAKVSGIDTSTTEIHDSLAKLKADMGASSAKLNVLRSQLDDLEGKRKIVMSTTEKLQRLIENIKNIRGGGGDRIKGIDSSIGGYAQERATLEKLMDKIGRLARKAAETVTKFESQQELAKKIAVEDRVIEDVKELVSYGTIKGVCGELGELVRMGPAQRKALLASSQGWEKAIVVEDLASGIQLLRKLNMIGGGSVKVIPLKEVKAQPVTKVVDETLGVAASFVRCSDKLRPAVDFVWGDTLVVPTDEVAIKVVSKGFRAVTIGGNVYESQGAMIGGRFREPIRVWNLIPSPRSMRRLQEKVSRLERLTKEYSTKLSELVKRMEEIRLRKERERSELRYIDAYLSNAKENVTLSQRFLGSLEERIGQVSKALGREEAIIKKLESRRASLEGELANLKRLEEAQADVKRLRRTISGIDGRIAQLNRNLNVDLYPKIRDTKMKMVEIKGETKETLKQIDEASSTLTRSRETLSQLKEERAKLAREIRRIDRSASKLRFKLSLIDRRIEGVVEKRREVSPKVTELHTDLALKRQELNSFFERLRELGYERPLATSVDEVARTEALVNHLKAEFDRIGSVNQLAIKQYRERVGKYKQVSERVNELEKDRRIIVAFIKKLEAEKRKVFMDSFTKVSERFGDFFARITDGGSASLNLESEESPLERGINMLVQFPGKSSILVSGASGGEKSVAVVSFILAISDVVKSPFCILDEIDAHLDQFYLERLANVLKDQSETSQIVAISRHSPVLSKADKVYGFYAQHGYSHVISLPSKVVA